MEHPKLKKGEQKHYSQTITAEQVLHQKQRLLDSGITFMPTA